MTNWQSNPEYRALLRGILERPDDDAPRLIIADWLEEHDLSNQAELIRLQMGCDCIGWNEKNCPRCKRARMLAGTLLHEWGAFSECTSKASQENADEIHGEKQSDVQAEGTQTDPFGLEYFARIYTQNTEVCDKIPGDESAVAFGNQEILIWELKPGIAADSPSKVLFAEKNHLTQTISRGFVSSVSLTSQMFMRLAKGLFERHPITEVKMNDKDPSMIYEWFFWCHHDNFDDDDERSSSIDDILYSRLKTKNDTDPSRYDFIRHANQDLSQACVSYGRELAGLPSLDGLLTKLKQRLA